MFWADVPPGALVLCPDGVQREVGPIVDKMADGHFRRVLAGKIVEKHADDQVLIVEDETPEAILVFMRAGFRVEVMPYGSH